MNQFNIRVYGIIINEKDEVLIADEKRHGFAFTKFPGGGLEWGEGTKDCIRRELQEELGLEAEIGSLFYVNDCFQQSRFHKEHQLISFYYRISKIDLEKIPVSEHDVPLKEEGEAFRWVGIEELGEEMLTFPVDKKLVDLLKKA